MILIIESEKLAVSYSASMDQVGIGSSSIYLYFLFSSLFLTTCHFFLLPFTITKLQATSTYIHNSSLSHSLIFSLCPLPLRKTLIQYNILFISSGGTLFSTSTTILLLLLLSTIYSIWLFVIFIMFIVQWWIEVFEFGIFWWCFIYNYCHQVSDSFWITELILLMSR